MNEQKVREILRQWNKLDGKNPTAYSTFDYQSDGKVNEAHTFYIRFMSHQYNKNRVLDFDKEEDRNLALDCYRFFDKESIQELGPDRLAKFIGTFSYINKPGIWTTVVDAASDALGETAAQGSYIFGPKVGAYVYLGKQFLDTVAENLPSFESDQVLEYHKKLIRRIAEAKNVSLLNKLIQLESYKLHFLNVEGPVDHGDIQKLYEGYIQQLSAKKSELQADVQNIRKSFKNTGDAESTVETLCDQQLASVNPKGNVSISTQTMEAIQAEANLQKQMNMVHEELAKISEIRKISDNVRVGGDAASLFLHVMGKHSAANKVTAVSGGVLKICDAMEKIKCVSVLKQAGINTAGGFAAGGPYVAIAAAVYSIFSAFANDEKGGLQKALASISKQVADLEKHMMKKFEGVETMISMLHQDMRVGFEAIINNQRITQQQLAHLEARVIEYHKQVKFWQNLSEISFRALDSKIDRYHNELMSILQSHENYKLLEDVHLIKQKMETWPDIQEDEFQKAVLRLQTIAVLSSKNAFFTDSQNLQLSVQSVNKKPAFSINYLGGVVTYGKALANPEIWRMSTEVLLQLINVYGRKKGLKYLSDREQELIKTVFVEGRNILQFTKEVSKAQFIQNCFNNYIVGLTAFKMELKKQIKLSEKEFEVNHIQTKVKALQDKIQAEAGKPMPNFGVIYPLGPYPHGEKKIVKKEWKAKKKSNEKILEKQNEFKKAQKKKIKTLTAKIEEAKKFIINAFEKANPKKERILARQKICADIQSLLQRLDNNPLAAAFRNVERQYQLLCNFLFLTFQCEDNSVLKGLFDNDLIRTAQDVTNYFAQYQPNSHSCSFLTNRIDETLLKLERAKKDIVHAIHHGKIPSNYNEIPKLLKLLQNLMFSSPGNAKKASVKLPESKMVFDFGGSEFPTTSESDSDLESDSDMEPGEEGNKVQDPSLDVYYDDRDLGTYRNARIEGLGGFRQAGYRFLLRGEGNTGTFGEASSNTRFYVAVTPAINNASGVVNQNSAYVNGSGLAMDFFLDATGQADGYDVFNELLPVMQNQANSSYKILFPFNGSRFHWLIGEVIINKKDNQFEVTTFAHDPYGGGQMPLSDATKIRLAIEGRIRSAFPNASFQFQNQMSPYGRRQSAVDGVSCGVITADDLFIRVRGGTLDREQPHSMGAIKLRREHIEIVRQYGQADNKNASEAAMFIQRRTHGIQILELGKSQSEQFDKILIDFQQFLEMKKQQEAMAKAGFSNIPEKKQTQDKSLEGEKEEGEKKDDDVIMGQDNAASNDTSAFSAVLSFLQNLTKGRKFSEMQESSPNIADQGPSKRQRKDRFSAGQGLG